MQLDLFRSAVTVGDKLRLGFVADGFGNVFVGEDSSMLFEDFQASCIYRQLFGSWLFASGFALEFVIMFLRGFEFCLLLFSSFSGGDFNDAS